MTPEIPPPQTRRMLHLALHGLVAVHAARAAHTALGAVPGIVSASVTMAGADVEVEGPFDGEAFAAAVPLIKQRELDAGKDDGFSNPQIAVGDKIGPVLMALEDRLGK